MGIESIPNTFNQIRLGRSFLRNFYMVLDYERNYIVLGLNLGGGEGKAFISESSVPGFTIPIKSKGGFFAFFLIIVLLLLGSILYYLYRKR